MRTTPRIIVLGAAVASGVFGCGSRDSLDVSIYGDGGTSGGATASGGSNTSGGSFATGGAGVTGGTGGTDVGSGGGSAGSSPVEIGRRCIACATTKCPQATKCLLDTACRDGTICLASTCFAAGTTPDPQCIKDCFDGDTIAAAEAILALTCLITNCTESCQP